MEAGPTAPLDACTRIEEVRRRLVSQYGQPQLEPSGDPRESLVQTILSQHTTDASAATAYLELRQHFPTWDEIEAAPLEDVAEAIRFAGLARQKALTVQTALRSLDDTDFHALETMSVSSARATLTAIRGIGDKTASCVLLFALGMPAQPVDTHIERVSRRIGVTGGARSATGIQHIFEHCLPADTQTMFAFHVGLIRHGREICTARAPRCSLCMMSDICDFFCKSSTSEQRT